MAGVRSKPLSSGKYRGWFMDVNREQKFFTGPKSRTETLRMAERLEDEHRQVRLGYRPVPVSADKHRARPVAEVVAEYRAWGESHGGRGGRPWSRTHAAERKKKLAWWGERLGLETLADLDGILPRVEEALREIQARGRSGATLRNYAEALRAFCLWCKQQGYLDCTPLDGLASFDTSPKTKRRAMTPQEIKRLLSACAPHRRLLYQVAFATGLRKNELRSLQVQHLDTRRGGLILDGAWTKNRRDGFQPLPSDLVAALAAFAKTGEARMLYDRFTKRRDSTLEIPERPLLYVPQHTARDIYKDLEAAGIRRRTVEGKADFHACRVAYVTLLNDAGANAKEAQTLARHSTPNMTQNTYARARQERLSEVTEAVGEMVKSAPNYAHSMHLKAAGAEGLDVSTIDAKGLASGGKDGGHGFEPRTLHHLSLADDHERDRERSRSFCVQTIAETDICPGRGPGTNSLFAHSASWSRRRLDRFRPWGLAPPIRSNRRVGTAPRAPHHGRVPPSARPHHPCAAPASARALEHPWSLPSLPRPIPATPSAIVTSTQFFGGTSV